MPYRHALRLLSAANLSLALLGCMLCTGCVWPVIQTTKAKYHAIFSTATSPPINRADPIKTVRVFIGTNGELYPTEFLSASTALIDPKYRSTLSNYYLSPSNRRLFNSLAAAHGIETCEGNVNGIWEQIQQALIIEKAKAIDSATTRDSSVGGASVVHGPLLVLIHGFNVGNEEHTNGTRTSGLDTLLTPRPYYGKLRAALQPFWAKNPPAAVLEVYWDGLKKNNPVGIWREGQGNARRAGLCLRAILARTALNTPLRVLTHSSGGIVATHAFWNVRQPYPPSSKRFQKLNDTFEALYAGTPTPIHADVRLGMIVPAMPGNAFVDFPNRTLPTAATKVTLSVKRVIIGQNRNDFAVSKFGFSPGNFGASSLGCLYTQYASFVPSVVGKEAYLIDFSQLGNTHVPPAIAEQFRKGYAPLTATSKAKARARGYEKGRSSLEEHSWHRYVQRQQFSEFAHLLFD